MPSLIFCALMVGAFAQKPAFEVASVKLNKSGPQIPPTQLTSRGDSFAGTKLTLRRLLQFAYGGPTASMFRSQIIGAPEWIDSDNFDVQAKLTGDAASFSRPQLQQMVRSLLEDRFQLRARQETRELPLYDVVLVKDGSKMKLSDDQTDPDVDASPATVLDRSNAPPRGAVRQIGMPSTGGILLTITGSAISIPKLINLLQPYAGRPLMDKTDLKGLFDFRLQFALESSTPVGAPPPDPVGASLFTAVQEQLGLKLDARRGPVSVLIIDRVEHPTEN